MTKVYVALIGDIVASRKLPDRGSVQLRLKKTLEAINSSQNFVPGIAAKFTVTVGDEFQALLHGPQHLFEMIDLIQEALRPVEVRIGLGLGIMTTELETYSIGADGPAYWAARDAIESVHQADDFGYTTMALRLGDTVEEKAELEELLNEILAWRCFARKKWTDTQLEVINLLLDKGRYTENFTRKDAAAELDLTSTALVKRVKAGGIIQYLRSAGRIEAALAALIEAEEEARRVQREWSDG